MSDIVELQSPDGDHATIQLHGKGIIMRILCAVHHVKELLRHHLSFVAPVKYSSERELAARGKRIPRLPNSG